MTVLFKVSRLPGVVKNLSLNPANSVVFTTRGVSWLLDIILDRNLKNKSMRSLKVSIEGNIGSGKSSLIKYFKQFSFIKTYDEPLDKWRDLQGHNLLGLLYEDLTKWNATFQSYVQLTRTELQSQPAPVGVDVQMFERSVQNNRNCFMENAFRSGLLSDPEYQVLKSWYEYIERNADISLDLIVYLRTTPDVVYKRIKDRNRPEEKNISMDYLINLNDAHERWLMSGDMKTPVCVIDANSSQNQVTKSYDEVIMPLLQPQRRSQHDSFTPSYLG